MQCGFVPDVSVRQQLVEQLAQLCTDGQLDPVHLMDVVELLYLMPLKMQKARRFRRASLLGQSTFSPLAVSTKTDPSISAAPRHISIRPRRSRSIRT